MLHDWVSRAAPEQASPPKRFGGSEQNRNLDWEPPPQVESQGPLADQEVQTPSEKVISKFTTLNMSFNMKNKRYF